MTEQEKINELMKPRYKVIALWPYCDDTIGTIFTPYPIERRVQIICPEGPKGTIIPIDKNRCTSAFYDQYFNDDKGYIEPIPLTSELLRACGFNIRPEKRFYIFHNERVLFEYWLLDGSILIEGGFIGYKIQYLHQLQNLFFALTNTELEVNPKAAGRREGV